MKYIDNRINANIVKLEDENNNYMSENVEGALEEIDSKIKNIEANGYDDTQIKQDINNIKTEIGTEELTTNTKNIKGSVNELNSQIKEIENNANIIKERDNNLYLEEEYLKTKNWNVAIENCLNQLKNINGGTLILPNKGISLTKPLIINKDINIKGSYNSKLDFSNMTNETCIKLENCRVNFNNFEIICNNTLTALDMSNDVNAPVADSIFNNIKITNAKNSIISSFAWDISFYDCRVQNCTNLPIFNSQSNQIAFYSCRFATFTNGFSFTNCEVISFNSCDFVTGDTLIKNLFQSYIYFNQSYIEHINHKIKFGGYNEQTPSVLMMNGGLITGSNKTLNITIKNKKPSSLKVKDIIYDDVELVNEGNDYVSPLSAFEIQNIKNSIPNTLIKKYMGKEDITNVYTKKDGGNSLITEIYNDFATIKPAPYNGVILSNSLVIGEVYTIVINFRSSYNFIIGQKNKTSCYIKSDEFRRFIFPFVASSDTIYLVEPDNLSNTSIDIKELSIYSGIFTD